MFFFFVFFSIQIYSQACFSLILKLYHVKYTVSVCYMDLLDLGRDLFQMVIICLAVWAQLFKVLLAFVVVLLFYVHGKHLRSCRDSQLT